MTSKVLNALSRGVGNVLARGRARELNKRTGEGTVVKGWVEDAVRTEERASEGLLFCSEPRPRGVGAV